VRTVPVELGDRRYEVLVGPGARHRLASVLPKHARRAAVVTQEAVGVDVDAGVEQHRFVIGQGEATKSLEVVGELCRGFARFGLSRDDVVVGVGGGVVTDTAGFAAACYHRGVAVVHVPTTLVGQVDAAIGGKSGVNLPEGKNLIGAFWQPVAVLCDTETLEGLPARERLAGLGEVAKYAFLGAPGLERLPLEEQVARSVAIKARFVEADERERSGRRALLNYGHTLAHAIEGWGLATQPPDASEAAPPAPGLLHGEAVATGLAFAARLARRLGRIGDERVRDHDEVLSAYGLTPLLPADAGPDELVAFMHRDKKARGGLTFVLDGPQGIEVVEGVGEAPVYATLEAMAGS
jgi:5-deoxy-5-amino-3-dehydroquinate synthase